ncbi:CHAD domain-containing protein [Stakelama tenebrarum]|uniref:CHAD domain-containing protein n=1 Tax=Stakelama tenebrarum TaxID=2711215 RepID=A0A6G6Y9V2_9SPHN|nr:CHAD domain-containing protein [Sphingosinithalassobacter tenebrarum]QIG81353.1 CHAD domain-containing protein [Sphingosinithalassobacter tenebrarum]
MSYRFKDDDESLAAGMRRIAGDQIGRALRSIADAAEDRAEAVHDVRKRCKKLRGLIRLVRPGFAGYAPENAAFRDIAKSLAGARDADALIDSYDLVADHYHHQIDRHAIASVRQRLTRDRKALAKEDDSAALLAAARAQLLAARERVRGWAIDGDEVEALRGGLHKSYKRGVKAMAQARRTGDPADFHEWRKRCKYHWYHLRLIRDAWPAPLTARAGEASALSDLLGHHHDLAVLRGVLAGEPERYGRAEDVELLVGLIDRRGAVLAARATGLGARLFGEAPDAMAERIAGYWRVWRDEGVAHRVALAE